MESTTWDIEKAIRENELRKHNDKVHILLLPHMNVPIINEDLRRVWRDLLEDQYNDGYTLTDTFQLDKQELTILVFTLMEKQ